MHLKQIPSAIVDTYSVFKIGKHSTVYSLGLEPKLGRTGPIKPSLSVSSQLYDQKAPSSTINQPLYEINIIITSVFCLLNTNL